MNSFHKQRTLAMMTGFERYTMKTRRATFLEEMEQVVPWGKLCALIEPHCPKAGKGRRAGADQFQHKRPNRQRDFLSTVVSRPKMNASESP